MQVDNPTVLEDYPGTHTHTHLMFNDFTVPDPRSCRSAFGCDGQAKMCLVHVNFGVIQRRNPPMFWSSGKLPLIDMVLVNPKLTVDPWMNRPCFRKLFRFPPTLTPPVGQYADPVGMREALHSETQRHASIPPTKMPTNLVVSARRRIHSARGKPEKIEHPFGPCFLFVGEGALKQGPTALFQAMAPLPRIPRIPIRPRFDPDGSWALRSRSSLALGSDASPA